MSKSKSYISELQIKKLIIKYLNEHTKCYYENVILDLLNELKISGMKINPELLKALYDSKLDIALSLIKQRGLS